jgi:PadR family transcriptional regulator, regulatory protein PadR
MAKREESRDLFPGALELMILQTLHRRPMHGYALAQHIKAVSDELLQIEEGSLYPALQRMLKAGWLKSEMGMSARNRPVRIFKVTAAGAKRLEEERSSFERMFAGIRRVLAT